jgi:hypothetical protein
MAIRRRGSSYKARPSNIDSLLLLGWLVAPCPRTIIDSSRGCSIHSQAAAFCIWRRLVSPSLYRLLNLKYILEMLTRCPNGSLGYSIVVIGLSYGEWWDSIEEPPTAANQTRTRSGVVVESLAIFLEGVFSSSPSPIVRRYYAILITGMIYLWAIQKYR